MSKTIKMNGVDLTKMFTRYGYSVDYKPVYGNAGGLMKDGTYEDDELKINAVVTLPVFPLNEDDLSTLLNALYISKYVALYYYDPKEKGYREAVFRRGGTKWNYKGQSVDTNEYWTGQALSLEEK